MATTSSVIYSSLTNSNSSLVNYVNRLSSHNLKQRTVNITCITVHISKKIGDIHDLAQMINSSSKSYTYGIDNSGTIGLFVDEVLKTDSSDNAFNDNRSVNIICMNESLEPDYRISELCYNALVELCEDICRRNFIFELIFNNDPKTDSLTMHSQFNSASGCPGKYVTSKLPELVKTINSRLNIKSGVNYTQVSSRLASSQSEALKAQSTIAVKSIKPYVVQPSPTMLNIDYISLKELGVVGTMLDAGERFNSKHEIVEYRTETIYKQTLEAKAANIPHSYIYTTHARTEEEVYDEAYWFRFVVSKYPPKLGVWLRCQFDVTKKKAASLVDVWYNYFVKWGLKSKCGIYATKEQATKIGWPAQCAYMPLWIEGSMPDSVCPDDELLVPSFFKLDNVKISSMSDGSVEPSTNSTIQNNSNSQSSSTTLSERKAEKVQTYNYEDITVPNNPKYKGMKKWESYTSISTRDERSYSITHGEATITDADGFRMVDDKYLVAVGSGICTTIGTYMDIILENGTKIQCIMGDIKPDSRTDATNHIFSGESSGTSYCCSEFIVCNKEGVLNPAVKTSGDCSTKQDSWKSPVKTIRVYTKNWFNKE